MSSPEEFPLTQKEALDTLPDQAEILEDVEKKPTGSLGELWNKLTAETYQQAEAVREVLTSTPEQIKGDASTEVPSRLQMSQTNEEFRLKLQETLDLESLETFLVQVRTTRSGWEQSFALLTIRESLAEEDIKELGLEKEVLSDQEAQMSARNTLQRYLGRSDRKIIADRTQSHGQELAKAQQEKTQFHYSTSELKEGIRTITALEGQIITALCQAVFEQARHHAEALAKRLQDPACITYLNDQLLQIEVIPGLEKLKEQEVISDAEAEEFLQLLRETLKEGTQPNWQDSPEQQQRLAERQERLRVLCRIDFITLNGLIHRVSAYSKKGDDFYTPMADLMSRGAALLEIENLKKQLAPPENSELLPLVEKAAEKVVKGEGLYSTTRKNLDPKQQSSASLKALSGLERWQPLRQMLIEENVMTAEQFEHLERLLIECFTAEWPQKGGYDSSEISETAYQMSKLNNPAAIPYLLKYVQSHGSGHTVNAMVHALDDLLRTSNPEQCQAVLENMPEVQGQTLKLLVDDSSYLLRFTRSNDFYETARFLKEDKRTLRQEHYAKLLEQDGYAMERLRDFYVLQGDRTNLLQDLKRVAELNGESSRQVIQDYFAELTSYISLGYPEGLDILPLLAEELGISTQEVFQKVENDLQKQLDHRDYFHNAEFAQRIEVCQKIAQFTLREPREVLRQYLPLQKIDFYTGFAESLVLLEKTLGVPALELAENCLRARVLLADSRSLEDALTSLRYGEHRPEDADLLLKALEQIWLKEREAGNLEVVRQVAYLVTVFAGHQKHASRTEGQRQHEDSEKVLEQWNANKQNQLNFQQKIWEEYPDDPVIRFCMYQAYEELESIHISRLGSFMDLRSPESQAQIREFQPFPVSPEIPFKNLDPDRLLAELLIIVDPHLKRVLSDSGKLGSLRESVLRGIVEFIGKLAAESSGETIDSVSRQVFNKLEQIRRTFESTDSSILERRALFLERYSRKDSSYPPFIAQVEHLMEEGMKEGAAIKQVVMPEFERLLVDSSAEDLKQYYERLLQNPNLPEKRRTEVQVNLQEMSSRAQEADQRNRRLYQAIQEAQGDQAKLAELILPMETSISQVGPSEVTLPILHQAALCDALLGEQAYEQEQNLASHVAQTRYHEYGEYADPETIAGRLPSFGNPHISPSENKNMLEMPITINRVYGDRTRFRHSPYGSDGTAESNFYMGKAHKCVFLGLPSTEITTILFADSDNSNLRQKVVLAQRQAIASKGIFIPLLNEQGRSFFTPEEFDRMRIFYQPLYAKGYPMEVIANAFEFFEQLDKESVPSNRQVVMRKAAAQVQSQLAGDEDPDDLAVLVDFLRTNDLNTHPLGWYEQADYQEIYAEINSNTAAKNRWRAREALFEHPDVAQWRQSGTLQDTLPKVKELGPRKGFINRFLALQASVQPEHQAALQAESGTQLRRLLFRESLQMEERAGKENLVIDVPMIAEAASHFTEQGRSLLQQVWNQAWETMQDQGYESEAYKKLLVPLLTGSGGRGEMTLGSDVDYALLVDDQQWSQEEREEKVGELDEFVTNVLQPEMNRLFLSYGVRPDAGLAKEDRKAFTRKTTLRSFEIDLSRRRQIEEPTEIVTFEPLFSQDSEMVNSCKEDLLVHNPSAYLLDSLLLHYLDRGSKEQSFFQNFEDLYASVASGNLLEKVKESLQRVLVFKLDHLFFSALRAGTILPEEAQNMPSNTLSLIQFLRDHQVLDPEEADTCAELWAITYKLRFLGEVFSDAGQSEDLQKVHNITFKLDDISLRERTRLFELLSTFRNRVLHK